MIPRYYIGLATTFHDPALAIVDADGRILFAEDTERHLQEKRAINVPADSISFIADILRRYCDRDCELVVACGWSRGMLRTLWLGALTGRYSFASYRSHGLDRNMVMVRGYQLPTMASYMYQAQRNAGVGVVFGAAEALGHLRVSIRRFEHHLAHAAHGCFTSPFEEAVCVVVDGMGEFGTLAVYRYSGGKLQPVYRHLGVASIGLFYNFVTGLCGFDPVRGEEWKVMGLAPYGQPDPDICDLMRGLVEISGGRPRFPRKRSRREIIAKLSLMHTSLAEDREAAARIAASGQLVFEELMLSILNSAAQRGISENLVLCGGCALNSSLNGKILSSTGFSRLHVPSAPADNGNAIGAAFLAAAEDSRAKPFDPRQHDRDYPYLGSEMSTETLQRVCVGTGSRRVRELPGAIAPETARLLDQGRIVGWVQGRAEFGPRALGNRSILADPRRADIRDRINGRVKFREEFRPFAPAVLHQYGGDYFADYQYAPFMERTLRFHRDAAGRVPAVVHTDDTGRLQSVTPENNLRLHDLLQAFHGLSGVPMLLNTSFNIMGKPIIHSVEDALGMLYSTDMDAVVFGDLLIEK